MTETMTRLQRDLIAIREDLKAKAEVAEVSVSSIDLSIDEDNTIRGSCYLNDPRMREIPYEDRSAVGLGTKFFTVNPITLVASLKIMPRWEREVRIMARKVAGVIELEDAIVSEAGRQFIEQMKARRDEFAGLLAGPTSQPSE